MLMLTLGIFLFTHITWKCLGHDQIIPNLNGKCYVNLQDLNLGILFPISDRGQSESQHCSSNIATDGAAETVEFLKYVLMDINKNSLILPNISLGYVFADTCNSDLVSLARALYFIPKDSQPTKQSNSPYVEECGYKVKSYPVFGVLGYVYSRDAVMAAPLFSIAQVPFLAPFATSDDLSDKTRFEFFMRMLLPDRFQVKAMMDFMQFYNFTYISLLHSDDAYGLNAAKHINIEGKRRGICIAYSKQITSLDTANDYDEVVRNLVRNHRARVVVLFLHSYKLLTDALITLEEQNIFNYFIFFASDSLSYYSLGKIESGCLFTFPKIRDIAPEFQKVFNQVTPAKVKENPWIHSQWETYYDCKWLHEDPNKSCEQFANKSKSNLPKYVYANSNTLYDAVMVYALALDNLVRDRCPKAFQEATILDKCIEGRHLLSYMKNLSFEGVSGPVKFNKDGDRLGSYNIIQYVHNDAGNIFNTVGTWNSDGESIEVFEDKIRWDLYQTNIKESNMLTSVPESACSKQCAKRQFPVEQEVHCCWICRECRNNEIIVNETSCQACPEKTWPDSDTARFCLPIEPTYMRSTNIISISLVLITGVFSIISFSFVTILVKNRERKLIKASGRELMAIIMFGIILAYVIVIFFIAKPSTIFCYFKHFGFDLSITLIYTPLLLKTSRVYRIFAASENFSQKLHCASIRSQITMVLGSLLIQVMRFMYVLIFFLTF